MLELKKFDLGLRTTALALLFVFIPFAVIGLHSEGNDYAIFPFAAIVV